MTVRRGVSLKELTTFKIGGDVAFVVGCESLRDVESALYLAEEKKLPWYVLGEGSNMVPSDEGWKGVVLLMRNQSIFFEVKKDDEIQVVCGAGVSFDALVREAGKRGLWGLENLAGIPGTVGAAPVQNIGAYGSEVAQAISYVEVFDVHANKEYRMSNEECMFSYRDSAFKSARHLIILRVAFTLHREGVPILSYPDLASLKESGAPLRTPSEIAEAVRAIRAAKFPDWHILGTAGSFFKNPVVSEELYAKLCARHGAIPRYPAKDGVKISLAFVLDKILGLRGYRKGKAWLFERQPLVLVAEKDAHASDIEALAAEVERQVFEATAVSIEREPQSFPKQ